MTCQCKPDVEMTKYFESKANGIVFWTCSRCEGKVAMIKENGDKYTAMPDFCSKCGCEVTVWS